MSRSDDVIYQKGKAVAQVLNAEVDEEAREVRFAELSNSDLLLLPDECEFRSYCILIRKIAYATKEDKQSLHKGRILRDVTAKIIAVPPGVDGSR
jgi:hypothetical protein